MIVTPDLSQTNKLVAKEKRMLDISKTEDGRDLISINFSSLSIINDCMRKAQYSLLRKLKNNIEAESLTFGKAIHKALEHWYTLPTNLRQLTEKESIIADTLIGSPVLKKENTYDTALDSINEFIVTAEALKFRDSEDKRSLGNGIKILKAYFKHYANDGLEVLRDEKGLPYIEKECEFTIHEDDEKVIVFHGTIDIILKNSLSKQIFIADHKTTAALGSAFYNRIKPNHQYTGYILAAQKCLGIKTDSFLVNGIQVAKTKCEFARQSTERNEEDFAELKNSVVEAVERMLKAIKNENFPMNSPNACNNFGSCQYYDICSSPKQLKETIIKSKYEGV